MKKTLEGIIVKGVGGLYSLLCEGEIFLCKAGGRLRIKGLSPMIGDRAVFEEDGAEGYIIKICERKNSLIRPLVANIDRLFIVASQAAPKTDPYLIDKVCVIAANAGIEPIVVLNKIDINPCDELFEAYDKAGISVSRVSAKTGGGVERLLDMLSGKVSAFTGNSGIGKSSLLNRINPRFAITVGDISSRIDRGKHTTRHVELFMLENGGLVADTPGFSSFDITRMEHIKKEDLARLFPEIASHAGECKFLDCAHIKEPGCTITQLVSAGEIAQSRYESYVKLYAELSAVNEWEK